MKSVMRYVSQTSKTLWDGQQLVSGIGCQPETAFDEFLSTKLLHHKEGGVMFYHMVQSFPKGANIDPRTAHEAAHRLAGYFDGCEVLVCNGRLAYLERRVHERFRLVGRLEVPFRLWCDR